MLQKAGTWHNFCARILSLDLRCQEASYETSTLAHQTFLTLVYYESRWLMLELCSLLVNFLPLELNTVLDAPKTPSFIPCQAGSFEFPASWTLERILRNLHFRISESKRTSIKIHEFKLAKQFVRTFFKSPVLIDKIY